MKYHVWLSSTARGAESWGVWFDADSEAEAIAKAVAHAGDPPSGGQTYGEVCRGCAECARNDQQEEPYDRERREGPTGPNN